MTFTNVYGVTIGNSSASGALNSQAITDMLDLGVTWLRYQVRWSLIDATGTTNQNAATYSWGAYDSAVSQCNAAGINILLSIMFAPSQFQGPGGNPLNPSYTATFASQIATRYNGGAHGTVNGIEVGNEDYNSGADTTSIPVPLVQSLALTMKAVYPAIKAVSSAITVGVACKLQRNTAGYTAFFDTLLNPATGPYISSVFQGDYINFHYYGCLPTSGGVPVSMDPTVDLPSWNGGNGLPSIKHAWQLIDAKRTQYSQTVPIWLTEAGYQVNANPGRAPACNNSEALAWQYDNAVLDSLRTSNVVSKWFRFTLGYYAGYTAPNYRDGMSLVQGTLASPHKTAAYNGLKTYAATYPTWGSGTGATFSASPNSLSFSATTGGANPANQTVTLSNTAGSSASYTVVDSAAWMSVSPTSGSVAAGGTANSTISVNISGLTAGTYTGSVTWTAGGQSDTTSVVLTVSDVTPPPPPGVTPLTAYFANAASLVTPTANQVYTIPGTPVDVNTASTLGTALNWGELVAQGTTAAWAASTTIGGPSGFGFLYGAKALEGNDLQPGTYTCSVRLNMIGAGAVSITADIHVRLWLWNAATGYNTQIVDCVLAGQTILTTKVNFAPTGTSGGVTTFGTGDKLYIEIKVKVLTNTGPAAAQIQLNDLSTDTVTFMGSSTASVATPGYSPTAVAPPPPPPPTSNTGLTISNTPVNMVSGSLQGKSKVGRRGELSCSVYDALGANHYQQYQQMALFDQLSNLVYSGYITSPVETKPGFSPMLLTSFTATDQHYLADKRIVANLYRNKTTGFIVQDIVTNILAAEGVTVGEIDAGLTIPIANFGYCTVATALDALVAAASGNGIPFYWVIDQNQVLWFVPYTAITGPTVDGTTIDSDGKRSGVAPSVTRANPKYRNTQYAVGGFQENGPWDETRQGDGQTRAFTFSYPLNAAPTTFTLNSVAKSIAIKGTVGAQYYWAPNDPVIAQDPSQTILVSTDRLHMIYAGQSSAVFNNQHVDQVLYMAGIDGTSGIVEAVITDPTINSFAQGQSVVGQGLTRYCTQGLLFTWATLQTGFAPGQLITVSYAPFGFSGTQMLVDEVAFSDQQDGFNLWYTVTAVVGPYDTNWTDFFGNIISPGLGIAQSINIGVAIAVPLYPSSTLFPGDVLYPS